MITRPDPPHLYQDLIMKSCDVCRTTILFGGVREAGYHFCSAGCRNRGETLIRALELSEDEIYAEALKLRESPCPLCDRDGPLDVFQSHWAYSIVSFTRWGSNSHLCCRRCARKKQALSTLSTLAFGWWGFPFGLLVTPYQVGRNIHALFTRDDPEVLSQPIWKFAQMQLAERMN
jgi:hypothetical protein